MSNDPKNPAEYDEREEGAPEGSVDAENLEKMDPAKIRSNLDPDADDQNEVPA